MLSTKRPSELSAQNILAGYVSQVRSEGTDPLVTVQINCGGAFLVARLTRRSVQTLGLSRGKQVYAVIKTVALDRHVVGGLRRWSDSADMAASIFDRSRRRTRAFSSTG
jgi:molybdate transport system ATP-binding protein